MPNIYDLFLLFLAAVAYMSLLLASVSSLALTLWTYHQIPQIVSVSLSVFSVALLGLAYGDSGPAVLLLLTITSMCWILIAVHQSLTGDYK